MVLYFSILIIFFSLSLLVEPSHSFFFFPFQNISHRTLSFFLISSSSSIKVPWPTAHHYLPLATSTFVVVFLHSSLQKPSSISPLLLFNLTLFLLLAPSLATPKPQQPMPLSTATFVEVFLLLFFLCLICGFRDLDLAWLLKIWCCLHMLGLDWILISNVFGFISRKIWMGFPVWWIWLEIPLDLCFWICCLCWCGCEFWNGLCFNMDCVKLNLFNHVLTLFRVKFACNLAIRYLVFRWELCKDSCVRECEENSRCVHPRRVSWLASCQRWHTCEACRGAKGS